MRRRISEFADWFSRGYRLSSAGSFFASLLGGTLLLALLKDVAEWLGPIWGSVFGVSVVGLAVLGTMAVLGYRDPLSPWQLAKRFRRLAERAARFNEEIRTRDIEADARREKDPSRGGPGDPSWRWHENAREAMWNTGYFTRIAPEFGALIEDMKDAGYEVPKDVLKYSSIVMSKPFTMDDMVRQLGVVGTQLQRRRIQPKTPERLGG